MYSKYINKRLVYRKIITKNDSNNSSYYRYYFSLVFINNQVYHQSQNLFEPYY